MPEGICEVGDVGSPIAIDGGSIGFLPYAPHILLNAPLAASYTITRLLPYPSDTNSSFLLGWRRSPEAPSKNGVVLPPVWPRLPICMTNFPLFVNFRIWPSCGIALPTIQTKPCASTWSPCSFSGHSYG